MKSIGMARKVDDLGRIVLPVELRKLFGIREGDYMEIFVEGDHIVLGKIEERCTFCGNASSLTTYRSKQVCKACRDDLAANRTAAS